MSVCGAMSGVHPMTQPMNLGPSMAERPLHLYNNRMDNRMPEMPDYRSNNVGPGYDGRVYDFKRLQDDALNSPNFAREYLLPVAKTPIRSDYEPMWGAY